MKYLLFSILFISLSLDLCAQQTGSQQTSAQQPDCCENKFTNFSIDQAFTVGSCLVPRAIRDKYYGNGAVGRSSGGQFIVPAAYMTEILRIAYNPNGQCYNPACVMELLGVEGTSWSGDPEWVRFDIKNLTQLHISLPADTNPGANSLFVPGGFTLCGIPERVIDQAPLADIADSLDLRICITSGK
jgi:hypothetical protein